MSESVTAILLGLPYVVDFCSGVSTFILAVAIFSYEEEKEEEERMNAN